jgi:hypothetical protein
MKNDKNSAKEAFPLLEGILKHLPLNVREYEGLHTSLYSLPPVQKHNITADRGELVIMLTAGMIEGAVKDKKAKGDKSSLPTGMFLDAAVQIAEDHSVNKNNVKQIGLALGSSAHSAPDAAVIREIFDGRLPENASPEHLKASATISKLACPMLGGLNNAIKSYNKHSKIKDEDAATIAKLARADKREMTLEQRKIAVNLMIGMLSANTIVLPEKYMQRLYTVATNIALAPIPQGKFKDEDFARIGARFTYSPFHTDMLLLDSKPYNGGVVRLTTTREQGWFSTSVKLDLTSHDVLISQVFTKVQAELPVKVLQNLNAHQQTALDRLQRNMLGLAELAKLEVAKLEKLAKIMIGMVAGTTLYEREFRYDVEGEILRLAQARLDEVTKNPKALPKASSKSDPYIKLGQDSCRELEASVHATPLDLAKTVSYRASKLPKPIDLKIDDAKKFVNLLRPHAVTDILSTEANRAAFTNLVVDTLKGNKNNLGKALDQFQTNINSKGGYNVTDNSKVADKIAQDVRGLVQNASHKSLFGLKSTPLNSSPLYKQLTKYLNEKLPPVDLKEFSHLPGENQQNVISHKREVFAKLFAGMIAGAMKANPKLKFGDNIAVMQQVAVQIAHSDKSIEVDQAAAMGQKIGQQVAKSPRLTRSELEKVVSKTIYPEVQEIVAMLKKSKSYNKDLNLNALEGQLQLLWPHCKGESYKDIAKEDIVKTLSQAIGLILSKDANAVNRLGIMNQNILQQIFAQTPGIINTKKGLAHTGTKYKIRSPELPDPNIHYVPDTQAPKSSKPKKEEGKANIKDEDEENIKDTGPRLVLKNNGSPIEEYVIVPPESEVVQAFYSLQNGLPVDDFSTSEKEHVIEDDGYGITKAPTSKPKKKEEGKANIKDKPENRKETRIPDPNQSSAAHQDTEVLAQKLVREPVNPQSLSASTSSSSSMSRSTPEEAPRQSPSVQKESAELTAAQESVNKTSSPSIGAHGERVKKERDRDSGSSKNGGRRGSY